jgi:hypothetical protein
VSRQTLRERIRGQLKPATDMRLAHHGVDVLLTSTNPIVCSPLVVTERYLKAAYGGHEGCIKSLAPGSVAKSISFKDLQVGKERARAVVVPVGGPYDGQQITVSLVRTSHWAVNALHSNVPVGP